MAWSTHETVIANPARKGNMTAKQIKYFGTKRQKAALRANRKRKRKNTARHAPAKHRARTRPRVNAPRKRRQTTSSHRKRTATKRRRRQTNPGEIIAYTLGNPARKRRSMASTKTKKHKARASGHHSNAARRARKHVTQHVTHRRHVRQQNAGQIGGTVKMAAAVIGGAVGSKVGAQLILGSKNTGVFGYLANAGVGAALAWGAKAFFRDRSIANGIIVGTAAQIIVRAIGDYSPFGSYLSGTGLGDYMVANWGPNRAVNGLSSAMVESPWGNLGTGSAQVVQSNGVPADLMGMGDGAAGRPC
jgi:hypothetical protein